MSKRDYYDILGLSRTATADLIRAAHRVQSRRYHPDTADDGKGDARLFAEIQEAYEALSNPDTRRRYDTKEGFERGEYSAPGRRRPPKTPCAICDKPVYSSQLTLYLGRHLCGRCIEHKRGRELARPRLTVFSDTGWQLKRLKVWAQSHFALLTVLVCAVVAVGARLITVDTQTHRGDGTTDSIPASATLDSPPANPVANPCLVPSATPREKLTSDPRPKREAA